jgi:hypothetical protein
MNAAIRWVLYLLAVVLALADKFEPATFFMATAVYVAVIDRKKEAA